MKKKVLLFTLLCILCLGSISFANNIGQDLQNLGNDTGKAIEGAVNNVKNGAENIGNNIGSEVNQSGDKVKNETNNMGMTNSMNNATNEVRNSGEKISNEARDMTDNGYTATRTSTTNDGTGLMNDRNMWVWAIIILAAVGIIAMIWYYFSQKNQYDNNH